MTTTHTIRDIEAQISVMRRVLASRLRGVSDTRRVLEELQTQLTIMRQLGDLDGCPSCIRTGTEGRCIYCVGQSEWVGEEPG